MAVAEVKLSSLGASGGFSSGDSNDAAEGGSYRSHYRVRCDSAEDAPTTVVTHFKRTGTLPWLGRTFKFGNGFDTASVCRGVEASYIESSGGWFSVECSFGPRKNPEDSEQSVDGQPSRDPFQWHDEIEVSYSPIGIPVEKATFRGFTAGQNKFMRAGKELALTHSNLIPMDPPPETELDIEVIRITKIAKLHDGKGFKKYNGAVNTNRVTIVKREYGFRTVIEPFCGRIRVVGGSFAIQNGVKFWRQNVEVHINPLTWRRFLLDQGTAELYTSGETLPSGISVNAANTPTGFKQVPITSDGEPISSPIRLDGLGKKLHPAQPPVYGIWSTYKEISFAGIRW